MTIFALRLLAQVHVHVERGWDQCEADIRAVKHWVDILPDAEGGLSGAVAVINAGCRAGVLELFFSSEWEGIVTYAEWTVIRPQATQVVTLRVYPAGLGPGTYHFDMDVGVQQCPLPDLDNDCDVDLDDFRYVYYRWAGPPAATLILDRYGDIQRAFENRKTE